MFQSASFPDVNAIFLKYCSDLQSVMTLNGLEMR